MSKKARMLAFLCLATLSFATTTVTGTLKKPDGTAVSSGVFVRFYLRGCSSGAPTVNGTAAFPSTGGVNQFYVDFAPNASGVISGTLYSTRDAAGTGNGEISCNGSQTNTWYGVVIYYNSRPTNEVPVHAKNTATLDITQLSPITTTPVVTAPTGDTTYCRLDASNCGFTGTVTFNNANPAVTATYDLGSSSFKWRDGWFSRNASIGGTLGVTGATTLSGGASLGGSNLSNANATSAGNGNSITLLNYQGIVSPITGNSAAQTFYTYTIPANTLGAGKGIRITILFQHSGVNSVAYTFKLGTCVMDTPAYADTNTSYIQYTIMNNPGVQNAQTFMRYAFFGASAGTAAAVATCTENLANSSTFVAQFNVANTDSLGPKSFLAEIIQ